MRVTNVEFVVATAREKRVTNMESSVRDSKVFDFVFGGRVVASSDHQVATTAKWIETKDVSQVWSRASVAMRSNAGGPPRWPFPDADGFAGMRRRAGADFVESGGKQQTIGVRRRSAVGEMRRDNRYLRYNGDEKGDHWPLQLEGHRAEGISIDVVEPPRPADVRRARRHPTLIEKGWR